MDLSTRAQERMYFFDNLRAFIVLLIVVFHVGMGFTTWKIPWWYVNDVQSSPFFNFFILGTDVYIMPIMFMIAGYFAPAVMVHKGIFLFWREKFWRIVLPWLVGAVFIAPVIAYSSIYSRTKTPPDYFSFWANSFYGPYYQQAHYWFLGVLALFFLLFSIIYQCNLTYFKKTIQVSNPSALLFLSFVLLTALLFFGANLWFDADVWIHVKYIIIMQPVRIGLCLGYFGLGVFAWKHGWFTSQGYKPQLLSWGIAALIMFAVFLIYRVSFTLGTNIPILYKAGHALMYAIFCLTATFSLLALFQKFFNGTAYLWRRLAANSYCIYYIHQCVVIPLAYAVQKSPLNIWIKYSSVSIAAVILCFLISEYVISPFLYLGKKDRADKKQSL